MKYIIDNDLHIHSQISSCSRDPEQTPEALLAYAVKNGFTTICIADHYWDERIPGASNWYSKQNTEHVLASLPLPQAEGVRFLFGCETEWNRFNTIGISREMMEKMDFIVLPLTHFHMKGFTLFEEQLATPETRAKAWCDRMDVFLSQDLPFHKIGLAHLTCGLIWKDDRENYLATLNAIPQSELERIFTRAAAAGVGIELNADDMNYPDEDADTVLRMYRIAKEKGCKFYLGSDAHHPRQLETAPARFARAIDALGLTEDDKFHVA